LYEANFGKRCGNVNVLSCTLRCVCPEKPSKPDAHKSPELQFRPTQEVMGKYERLITVDASATQQPTASQTEDEWDEWQIELLGMSETKLELLQAKERQELADERPYVYTNSDWRDAVKLSIEQHRERCLHRVLHRRKTMALAKVPAPDLISCVSSCCFR
jgi:hypothetical protein